MLGSIQGRPTALILPILKATVWWVLAWRPATLAAHRARLLTVVAKLAAINNAGANLRLGLSKGLLAEHEPPAAREELKRL